MIAQAGVSDQIYPFDDLDETLELSLQLVNAAPAVCRRPPCTRMNVKPAGAGRAKREP